MTATIALTRLDWLSRLRTIMVLRAGQRHVALPGDCVEVRGGRNTLQGGGDWWLAGGAPTPIAVYQPKGAASLAASYVNLVNPGTYDAAPGTAPTFDASGWVFLAASSQYLSTGYKLTPGWAALVRLSDSSGTGTMFGQEWQWIQPSWAGGPTQHNWRYGATQTHSTPNITSGVMALVSGAGYINGIQTDAFTPGAFWDATAVAYIGARNASGSATGFWTGKIQAVAIWNTSTDHATWMPAVSAAVGLI